MNKTLWPIRVVFVALCGFAGGLVCHAIPEWDRLRAVAVMIGLLLGVLVVLVDLLLRGFSLRGLSAVTFGLGIGSLIGYLLSVSPLFAEGDPQMIYLARLGLFLVCGYLGTVIALRGKDEFNLVIPYVRFVPHDVDVPLVVVDASALIDGRIVKVCESGFLGAALVIPRFVLNAVQTIADSPEPHRQARGRRGLEVLNELRRIPRLDLRLHESDARPEEMEAKLVFLARSLQARLLTTDYNLAKLAEFQGVKWLNLHALARSLRVELALGQSLEVELVKAGKEPGQAVGFLEDGSMVVVPDAVARIGQAVRVEITSLVPTTGGKLAFARLEPERRL